VINNNPRENKKAFDKSNAYNNIFTKKNNSNTHCHFDESGFAG